MSTYSARNIYTRAMIRPFVIFGNEPIAQVVGVYMAFVYGVYYSASLSSSLSSIQLNADWASFHDGHAHHIPRSLR